jgi:hypothetical protein
MRRPRFEGIFSPLSTPHLVDGLRENATTKIQPKAQIEKEVFKFKNVF